MRARLSGRRLVEVAAQAHNRGKGKEASVVDPQRESLFRRFGYGASRARRQWLARIGVERTRTSNLPVQTLAFLLLVLTAIAVVSFATGSLSSHAAIGIATAMITIASLLVATLQWRAGLAEKAIDAFYQRIAYANKMRVAASEHNNTADEAEIARQRAIEFRFFVYTEIDSLEYATLRYRFGLGMSHLIAERAVRHFRGRCETKAFFDIAGKCAIDGAYLPETKRTVASILETVGEKKHWPETAAVVARIRQRAETDAAEDTLAPSAPRLESPLTS
jgi:hypothetical protein